MVDTILNEFLFLVTTRMFLDTVFPILFFFDLGIQRSQFMNIRKLFLGENYSREETVQGRKLYDEILYTNF